MHTCMLPPEQWAEVEFGGAELGDARRTSRLLKVASALVKVGCGTLPPSLCEWDDLKAAYRFLGNAEICPAGLLEPHRRRTRQRCDQQSRVLLIEDTTSLDYSSHLSATGLGRIGDDGGQGLHLHTTLAVSFPELRVLGVFAHHCWVRPPRTDGRTKKSETAHQRLSRARESQRWGACLREGPPLAAGRYTLVADREGDIYELFVRCQAADVDFVIRVYNDRALEGDQRHLLQAARESPVRGYTQVSLRARPGQKSREAKLEIRSSALTLRAPAHGPAGRKLGPIQANVLVVREVDAPAGVEPIEWILLTNWATLTLRQCQEVVAAYEARWLIEEYHKCLKTGCEVEKSQLSKAASLQRLVALAAVISVRLLDRKLLARQEPQGRGISLEIGPAAVAVLESRYAPPAEGWTNRQIMRHIAKLGGFLGRKGDGEPGWITIWRGSVRLQLLIDGYVMGERCG